MDKQTITEEMEEIACGEWEGWRFRGAIRGGLQRLIDAGYVISKAPRVIVVEGKLDDATLQKIKKTWSESDGKIQAG